MSVSSKSIDKNKRYAGVKANDFVNKTRTNEASRAAARTQGWANLGKINSRRVPPPANLPSLKSETGINPPQFDPTIPTGTSHGWTASGNPPSTSQTRPLTPSKQPTQQQLDSLPAHSSTPPPSTHSSSDHDKPRLPTTWSTVTAGNNPPIDQPPNLLGLNDFPRLVTQETKQPKSPSDSVIGSISTSNQGPSLRPANLASWKEGGGRAQPIPSDLSKESNDNSLSMQSQVLTNNTNTNSLQSQIQNPNHSSYMRVYQQQQPSQQMWSYNQGNPYGSYGPNQAPTSMPMHQHQVHHHQQQSSRVSHYTGSNQSQNQQRHNTSTDYKTPTILRNKDIDDLSKLTDNVTWASASQEVNYEEKIRFSDDEDNDTVDHNTKSRRFNNSQQQQQSRQNYPQVLQNNNRSLQTTRSRLLQDDDHVKQMQDDKNSELISTLTVAKQRRDEQERHLRDQRTTSNEQKQIPGYQTRPLLTSAGQENLPSSQTDSSSWGHTNSGTTTATTTTTTTATIAASRTRHDTADSQTFAMKSWSDQMDSFNYASLHEKSGGQVEQDDDPTSRPRKYSRSHSESSSHSQTEHGSTQNRSKHFPIPSRKPVRSNITQPRFKSKTNDVIDYFDNTDQQMKSNEEWVGGWDDSNYSNNNRYQQQPSHDRRRQQQQHQSNDEQQSQKPSRYNEQVHDSNRTKQPSKVRSNTNRSSDIQSTSSTKSENKSVTNRNQPAWRPLSPTRPPATNDPTPQEAISYKSQMKTNEITDRRQSAPNERKSRYATTSAPINTSSIPPLMSVRSDVPPTGASSSVNTAASKHFKTSNQSQRQDYNTSSHYSQRNDFYNETNDSAWGNDDEYYDDDTGYYDSSIQTHQRHSHSMGYQNHLHHRGYTTLGSYGRYRRGGTLRHQQQYSTYNTNNTAGASSALNTSTGSKTKKIVTSRPVTTMSKKTNELPEQIKSVEESEKVVVDEPVKKPSAWTTEPKSSSVEEIPIIKTVETPPVPAEFVEKPKEVSSEQKTENESNVLGQTETDSTSTNKKLTTTTTSQKKTNKDQQNYYQDPRYSSQQTNRHRNTYARSAQDYENVQMSSHYFGTSRRAPRGGRGAHIQDLSSGYYYEHPQQHYSNRYSYSTDHYQQRSQTRSGPKTSKRGSSAVAATTDRQQTKSQSNTGNSNLHLQSVSDNEQKEGEEWETASESSANMRNNHHESNHQAVTNETKPTNRDRTPPKKSFSSQRPTSSRYNEGGIHRRAYNLYDRGNKSTRGVRASRLTTNQRYVPSNDDDEEILSTKQARKDQHRHSLDGYDLNNVAGVVKIETLPASALEEESAAFDDGGEEFCVVMSKRGRKEQKAAQLSKQNAVELPNEQSTKSGSIDNDEQQSNEKSSNDPNQASSTRSRNGKSLPPRFNSKSSTRQSKNDSMYYYDQNYYYYDQNQYYDHDGSYYNYNNYNNQTQRQPSTRRKPPRTQPSQETIPTIEGRKPETEKVSSNVMSNIQMWDPHTDSTISNPSKLIEKPTHERKFANEIAPKDASLPLPLASHSTVSKPNETIARTIKPPMAENKTERETKAKSSNYEKNDTISSLGSNQLFEKSTFLDYDDKQSIGTVGDDYNQKINSLKTIWDISDHQSVQLEQTISTMVAMQQHQDGSVQSNNPTKSDNYVQESISTPSSGANTNVSAAVNDDATNKNPSSNANLQSTGSSSTINQSSTYSTNPNPGKNEQKNICTVKPTQQVPPNIQDQVDVNIYHTFPPPPSLPPPMSQPSLQQQQQQQQQQQHLLSQSQVNPLHQQHSYQFYDNIIPPPPPQQQQPQQQQFSRMYSSTTNSTSTDPLNSDFSSIQSSQLYPTQNFSYRNANVYIPPPNVPNTNSMYHHTSQGSISAPPQNNAMPPPMGSYPSPFLVDAGGHMISQPQPPQAYMNNQMMSGRPQGGPPYYRTPPQQQLQTPPGGPYNTQDPLAHGGYYPPFFQPPNSNAPPVGHPSPHNLYGQNEGFHPPPPHPHPQMFARGGSIDRGDHPLMSQPLSRPANYPSASSNQQQQPQAPPSGAPPSLLSQNLKSFHTNQPQTSSSNQAPFYPPPPPNQYNRQPVPIGAMNTTSNRQQTQQVPSLMSGLSKTFPNTGNNLNNTPSLFQHRQPLLPPQSNNNRPLYPHHTSYSNYSKSTGPNDDNVKPKHI